MLSLITNMSSITAENNLTTTETNLNTVMGQLSSGYRITSAGIDAAGLGISTNLEAQISSYSQGVLNANDGVSIVQTAEGALTTDTNILTRLRELAMESSSSGVGDTERTNDIQVEAGQLTSELQRISQVTQYNGTSLLDGSNTALSFQVGVNGTANDAISFTTLDATASTLGVSGLNLSTQAGAQAALSTIDLALTLVSNAQAAMGAVGNRLQDAVDADQAASQSLSSSDSAIKDVDVAQATATMSKESVLEQAGISVLAQANQQPQLALKLLQ